MKESCEKIPLVEVVGVPKGTHSVWRVKHGGTNGQITRPSTQLVPGGQFIAEHGLIVSEISAREINVKDIVVQITLCV